MKLTIPIFYDDYAEMESKKLNDVHSRLSIITHHTPHQTTYTLSLCPKWDAGRGRFEPSRFLHIYVRTVGGCAVT